MKAIHSKVNIVPVIAKADTLTLKERDRLKRRVGLTFLLLIFIFLKLILMAAARFNLYTFSHHNTSYSICTY